MSALKDGESGNKRPCCSTKQQSQADSPCCSGPPSTQRAAPCCGGASFALGVGAAASGARWIEGVVATPAGGVPRVTTSLTFADRLGGWKARWAIGRMRYSVEPGLYAVGSPTPESPVFVSANYTMSFDRLRSNLGGREGWILVLDTKGINVWCAAGKGTFGTDELVARAAAVRLDEVVARNVLIVPQLGATGVSAHEVKRRCGFRVVYGPVRAEDLPAFLDAGMKTTPEMRRVRFDMLDRMVLIPVELVMSVKYVLLIAAALLLLAGLGRDGFSLSRLAVQGVWQVVLFVGAFVGGSITLPALLPWLPGRAFSAKGVWIGLLVGSASLAVAAAGPDPVLGNWAAIAGWLLFIVAVASFSALNFTGATTYTSLSGVRREMRVALPLQIGCAAIGLALWLVGRFV